MKTKCNHANVEVRFKSVSLWKPAGKDGKVKLPKAIKMEDLCVASCTCYYCGERVDYKK